MTFPDSRLATLALGVIASGRLPELSSDEAPECAFLRSIVSPAGEDLQGRRRSLARALESDGDPLLAPSDHRLLALRHSLGLADAELLAVALALASETELLCGRALAFLQAPVGGSRPVVGALASFDAVLDAKRAALDALAAGAALDSGLLAFADPGLPYPERSLLIPDHLVLALRGLPPWRRGARLDPDADQRIPLPPSVRDEAERQARGLEGTPANGSRALVIRSGSESEGQAAACAVAHALGREPLFLLDDDVAGVVPWLVIDHLLPVFVRELAPAERVALPALRRYTGPVVAVCGLEGSIEHRGESTYSWSLPVPSQDERRDLWRKVLPGDEATWHGLARDHRHGSARIAELGRLAGRRATLDGRSAPTRADVVEVSWMGESSLDSFAIPMHAKVGDDALVVTPQLERDLLLLQTRCRRREELVENLGASAKTRYRPGVRSLFVGPSGTGKTLAAGWLATRLGLPLYRVDLASVVSKYIGETEKNLAQLLARAEHAEVVLLFDEADSLFGKRTEVKQSTDRFANAQTNYLLQRMESYDGIVVLTSNSRSRFDPSFTRRLDLVIDFPKPGPEDRRRLWLSHLGDGHTVEFRRINQLSATVDLAGGHVRNVVLTAAVRAHDAGRPITWSDLVRGLAVEYRKLGKQPPASLREPPDITP